MFYPYKQNYAHIHNKKAEKKNNNNKTTISCYYSFKLFKPFLK